MANIDKILQLQTTIITKHYLKRVKVVFRQEKYDVPVGGIDLAEGASNRRNT